MARSSRTADSSRVWTAATLLLPFVLLYWLLGDLTIGNDYPMFSVPQQQEIAFSLRMGSFPLFVPGFAGGMSSAGLTLGQLHHPLTHVVRFMPGYWSGGALSWATFLRLVTLGLAHLALLRLFVRFGLGRPAAFLLGCVAVYNLRMLDMFRYGASLESYTGLLFLFAAIAWHGLEPNRWRWLLAVAGATFWLVTSGHPQMMYYGLLGAGALTLIVPSYLRAMVPRGTSDSPPGTLRESLRADGLFFARIGGATAVGLLLSAPYVFSFYFEFLKQNAERVGRDYAWANSYADSFLGTVNNFFQPLYTSVVGAFGGTALWLVAALVPLLLLLRVRVPPVIWITWGMLLVCFLHVQGDRTPVHWLAWKFLPLASSFRVAGRVSMLMPLLFVLVLAWAWHASGPTVLRWKGRKLDGVFVLAALSALLTLGYELLSHATTRVPTRYAAVQVNEASPSSFTIYAALGLAALCALAVLAWHRAPGGDTAKPRKSGRGTRKGGWSPAAIAAGVLVGATCLQAMTMLRDGTWVMNKPEMPTLERLLAEKGENLDYRENPGRGLYPQVVLDQLDNWHRDPFLGRLLGDARLAGTVEEAFADLRRTRLRDSVVLVGAPAEALQHVEPKRPPTSDDTVELTYSSFNRLTFTARSSRPAFFTMGHPWSGNWRATVNGEDATVYRANGASNAVAVPAGESTVDFRYWSWPTVLGRLLATLALLGAGIATCLLRLEGLAAGRYWPASSGSCCWARAGGGGGCTTAPISATSIAGPDRRPARERASPTVARSPRRRSPYGKHRRHMWADTRGNDGRTAAGSGFCTWPGEPAFWTVDLGRPTRVAEVVLHEADAERHAVLQGRVRRRRTPVNVRPLLIEGSLNGRQFRPLGRVTQPVGEGRYSLPVPGAANVRFVRVRATGKSLLALDEVEVFAR